MKSSIQLSLILTLLISALSNPIFGQFKAQVKSESPYFFVKSTDPGLDQLPLKNTDVKVNIAGVIADVTVSQVYKNEGINPIEAIYVFPGSTNAAVYGMQMQIENRTIIAEIKEKNQARKEYEKAKSEGKRASLLEQHRPNVFQMNVSNIMPGDEIKVVLQYTEKLIPEDGIYSFVYPTVVGPRYTDSNNETASANSAFPNTPYTKSGQHSFYDFDLKMTISAGMPIQDITCLSHSINKKFDNLAQANISLDTSERKGGNRDFILDYRLSGDKINSGLLLYEHEDENFFMLTVQPPKRINENQVLPREYVFIVDVSGSMNGFPLDVSKKLLRNLISNLRTYDRFNILLFAGGSKWLADESWEATEDNLNKAINFIDNQSGGGSTNLLSAMKRAMALKRCEENLSRSFIVVTDGYISADQTVLDYVSKNLDQANVFAFGIGSSVNRHLIDGLAHVGQGEPLIVTKPEEANGNADRFRKYISYPVLSNIKIGFDGFEVYDVEPKTQPDLMAERPIVILGKYKGSPNGKITISGATTASQMNKTFQVASYVTSKTNQAIRYLWAREKVKILSDYNRFRNDKVSEITNLGLKYNLMTDYTSFIAIDHVIANKEGKKPEQVKQALPMPQGVPNTAIGFDLGIEKVVKAKPKVVKPKMKTVEFELDGISISLPSNLSVEMQNQIKKLIGGLKWCAKGQVNSQLVLEITLDKTGKVSLIKILKSDADKYVEVCLTESISNWQFSVQNTEREINFQLPIKVKS